MFPSIRPHSRRALFAALLTLIAPPGLAFARAHLPSVDPILDRADSLQSAGAEPAAFALLDSLQRLANAAPDSNLHHAVILARAHASLNQGRWKDAGSAIRGVLPSLARDRDTLGLCRAWRDLARVEDLEGHRADARTMRTRSLALAREANLTREQGRTWSAIAGSDFDDGRLDRSIVNYRRAVRLLAQARDDRGRLRASADLASSLQMAGRTDEARRASNAVRDDAVMRDDPVMEARALSNLGAIELVGGDPRQADSLFRRALGIYQDLQLDDRVLWATNAISIVYLNLDRLDEADSTLMHASALAKRVRNVEYRSRWLCQMGVVRREQRRLAEAEVYGRRGVAQTDSLTGPSIVGLISPLVATLRRMHQQEAALALIDSQLVRVGARLPPAAILQLASNRGAVLQELGRPREALEQFRVALGDVRVVAGGIIGSSQLDGMRLLASDYWALGQRDSALIWYRRAAKRWEEWRGTTTDPLWREKYDDFALTFAGRYAIALLDSSRGGNPDSRARDAFDAMQGFRARTLTDRICAPGAESTTAALEPHSREIQLLLAPNEAFVDLHAMYDTSVVFVLTRNAIRAYPAPRSKWLGERLGRLRDLCSDPSGEGARMLNEASSALGGELLGPAADLISGAQRVLFAAGSLAAYPLPMLIAPGERTSLLEMRECSWVPSAGLLVRARRTPALAQAREILAIAPPEAGADLIPGAQREAEWLSQSFARCDVLTDDATSTASKLAHRVSDYSALHFAAHTRSGGSRPWQDAIRVSGGASESAWLTAAEIARFRAPVNLCVLAGCSSIGGETPVVETLQGLSTAWLVAGARTVIATQWPADDEATWRLMRGFYSRLARGERAGEALRGAQLELRDEPGFANPRFWAAATLVGDPDTRVRLEPRAATAGSLTGGAAGSKPGPGNSHP